jgi:hypothetical protein
VSVARTGLRPSGCRSFGIDERRESVYYSRYVVSNISGAAGTRMPPDGKQK